MWWRILLILLLPAIFAALYLEGQHYEPQLIRFSPAPPEAELKALLPERINDFNAQGSVRIYRKDNLYEYINGHAEYFISAGFRGLIVREYTDRNNTRQFITEVYRMNRGLEALGVLVDEASPDAVPVSIGVSGYVAEEGISFVKGPYYIKIRKLKGTPALKKIALALSDRIRKTDSSLDILKEFPPIGTIIRTEYHREAFMGVPFLNEIVVRRYSIGERGLTLFLKRADRKKIKDTMEKLLRYFKENDVPFKFNIIDGNKIYTIDDPYEGRWYLFPAPGRLIGFSGSISIDEIKEILNKMPLQGEDP
ncbi:MAG: hypothetical protein GXO97_03960 [Nitrospirae bacterium]|nr:hypothetical protein [Nitrospirota bacterium]